MTTTRTLADVIAGHARSQPSAIVALADDAQLSWALLYERATRLSNALAGLGVRPGQQVAVLCDNRLEHIEVVLALAQAGAVWVPVNYRLAPPEMAFIIADSDAVALLYSDNLAQAAAEAATLASLPMDRRVAIGSREYNNLLAAGSPMPGPAPAGADLFTIMYTSGTTGRAKGVQLTHEAFLTGTELFARAIGARPHDRLLVALPQFHAGGAIYQFAYLLVGGSVVVLPRFAPERAVQVIGRHAVTVAGMVPAMLRELTAVPRIGERVPTLRRVMYGGAPISVEQLRAAMTALPVDYVQTYGLTESGVIACILDSDAHRRGQAGDDTLLRSCGRAIAGYRVRRVADPPDADVGEIHIRSRSLMRGYWRQPDATAEVLVAGWLRTGDLATQDDDGYLYLVDRRSDMIITGGENVYPSEVEAVLATHPDIREVVVLGVPDERWGETVCAYLVAHPGATVPTVDDLREFCAGRIAGYKRPRVVRVVNDIPRNPSGKVLRRALPPPSAEH